MFRLYLLLVGYHWYQAVQHWLVQQTFLLHPIPSAKKAEQGVAHYHLRQRRSEQVCKRIVCFLYTHIINISLKLEGNTFVCTKVTEYEAF